MNARQLPLPGEVSLVPASNQSVAAERPRSNGVANKLAPADLPAHDWYRFVLSFPPHLVREYLARFGAGEKHLVLDPFCGTGTTLVECKKLGIPSLGLEAHPMAHFAAATKTDWSPDPDALVVHATRAAKHAAEVLAAQGIHDTPQFANSPGNNSELHSLPQEAAQLLLTNSMSPLPLHKVLVLLDTISQYADSSYDRHEKLALARALVTTIGNLHFGPEVGVGRIKADAAVIAPWLENVKKMASDLRLLPGEAGIPASVALADARDMPDSIPAQSIDVVFTSPPYPNEKDYTRTTRLESVLLGFVTNNQELRALKRTLVRSNTRNVYKDDEDHQWIEQFPEITRLANEIEEKRQKLGKTSGFERLYHRVTLLYFGGMARHFANLRRFLRPGAKLGYVVGDQASYLRVMIRTGQILARVAQSLGYEVVGIDLFRTRLATASREQLREEVVLLRWPG